MRKTAFASAQSVQHICLFAGLYITYSCYIRNFKTLATALEFNFGNETTLTDILKALNA